MRSPRRGWILMWVGLAAAGSVASALAATPAPAKYESEVMRDAGQGEPEIAVDPTKPGTIVVSLNTRGVATSHDRGRTWKFTSLPNQGDTVLTVDVAGRFYYSSLDGDVQESRDHGDHWRSVGNWVGSLAAQWEGVSPDALKSAPFRWIGCNAPSPFGPIRLGDGPSLHVIPCDRPWLKADTAVPGVLQLSFTDHSNGSGGDAVGNTLCVGGTPALRYAPCGREFVSTSLDGGRSWGPFRPVDAPEAPAALTNGFAGPVLSDHGLLAAAYVAGKLPGSRCYPCFVLAMSADGGRNWTRRQVPATVGGGDLEPGVSTPRVGPGTTVAFEPYLAQDPSRTGRFAVGIFDDAQSLIVYVTRDSGRTWSRPARFGGPTGTTGHVPWIAYGPTGALGVMWKQASADGATFNTFASVAPLGDNHFMPPVLLSTVTSQGPAEKAAYDDASSVVLDASTLHAVWGDWRDPDKIAVYYGGLNFAKANP